MAQLFSQLPCALVQFDALRIPRGTMLLGAEVEEASASKLRPIRNEMQKDIYPSAGK